MCIFATLKRLFERLFKPKPNLDDLRAAAAVYEAEGLAEEARREAIWARDIAAREQSELDVCKTLTQ
jgi:hypothetical protein